MSMAPQGPDLSDPITTVPPGRSKIFRVLRKPSAHLNQRDVTFSYQFAGSHDRPFLKQIQHWFFLNVFLKQYKASFQWKTTKSICIQTKRGDR